MLHNFCSHGQGRSIRWSPEGNIPIMTKKFFSGKGFDLPARSRFGKRRGGPFSVSALPFRFPAGIHFM
jgi:hypothetical protein